MKNQHNFPPLDPNLLEKIQNLTKQVNINSIFYHPAKSDDFVKILMITETMQDMQSVENSKWVKNALLKYQTLIQVQTRRTIEIQLKKGNPFLAVLAQKDALVYTNSENPICFEESWKSFKKKVRVFTEEFFYDHNTLLSELKRLEKLNLTSSTFLMYEALLIHDISFLELLFLNTISTEESLHPRIIQLSQGLPEISRLFVKENHHQFYLINQIEQVKTAIKQGDDGFLNPEILPNLKGIEQKLYYWVYHRIEELKELLKAHSVQTMGEGYQLFPPPKTEMEEISSHIFSFHPVEEIFLFHLITKPNEKILYLLVVADKIGTSLLNQIQQSYHDKTKGKVRLVLLGHSRIWIQKEVFAYQKFFQNIMKPENRIYKSHAFHPTIHWEEPYSTCYPDLEYYAKSALLLVQNFKLLKKKSIPNNDEGLENLFFQAFYRILRTFIFAKLNYLPHYLSAQSLWELCLYAEPKLEKLEYLMEEIKGNKFFQCFEKHSHFHHDLTKLSKNDQKRMKELLENLQESLEISVKKALGKELNHS